VARAEAKQAIEQQALPAYRKLLAYLRADYIPHARTTLANPIERALIAPYWVNYHAEHHLFMYLPCYRLPEAHRLLIDKGLIKRMEVRPGYWDVMKLATSKLKPAIAS